MSTKKRVYKGYFQNSALLRTHERVFLCAPPTTIKRIRERRRREQKIFGIFVREICEMSTEACLQAVFSKPGIVTHSRTRVFARASRHKKTIAASAEGESGKLLRF